MRKRLYILCSLFILITGHRVYAQDWKTSFDSAIVHRDQKSFDKAIGFYNRAIKLLPTDSAYSETIFKIDTAIGNIYFNRKSQFANAEVHYKKAALVVEKRNENKTPRYASVLFPLGLVTYLQKHFDEAEQTYLIASVIWEQSPGKLSREYAGLCNAMGILYNDGGQYDKAEQRHLEARTIREQLTGRTSEPYAQSCNNLAAIYWNRGWYDKAEPLSREAKEIRSKLPDVSRYAVSCVNLANIYRDMGKYKDAEEIYIEAKNIREKAYTKDHNDYALSCDILADLYYYMKDYDKAEKLYVEAKSIREKIFPQRESNYAQSCSSLSSLYTTLGKYDLAESLALEANAIWKNYGDAATGELAVNNNSIGSFYFSLKQYSKAEEFFLKARTTWEKSLGVNHPYYTSNTLSLARVYWMKNEITKANEFYVSTFDAQVKQAGDIFSFTSEEEKIQYLKNVADTEDEYQSFYFSKLRNNNNGQPYRISLQKRNQVLASAVKMRQYIYESGKDELLKSFDEWTGIRKQVAALYSKGEAAPKDYLKKLITSADELEKKLVKQIAGFSTTATDAVDWKKIKQSLKPGEASIEFIEFNYFDGHRYTDSTYYAALVLKNELSEPEFVTLCEKKELDSLLTGNIVVRQNPGSVYTRGGKVEREDSLRSAYSLVWQPLEAKLKNISKIYFAPAGLLHRVSFAAINIDSATVVSKKYRLVQLSTTASINETSNNIINTADKIVLFGGVVYSKDPAKANPPKSSVKVEKRNGFEFLPGSEKEVTEIKSEAEKNKFKPVIIKGLLAKEDSVKHFNGKSSPAILHIATHGFFFDDPAVRNKKPFTGKLTGGNVFQQSDNPLFRSGLLFAGANDTWRGKHIDSTIDDGILTAYEISNMYLPNTKLAVLSACETALGDIQGSEGVYGLQRSLKMAGVKNLIMSLWKVPDEETAEFMQELYKGVFKGHSIDESFYNAQTIMRNKYQNAPFKWAAWVLIR
jgi:CHAT domain-containing protein/tetratricopeptide (TPR) repeat protein